MLNIKKLITITAVLAVLTSSVSAFANDTVGEQQPIDTKSSSANIMSVESFASFGGIVTEINIVETDASKATYVSVEKEEVQGTIVMLDDTYIVDNAEIEVGDVITGYYNANGIMPAIYPPQYRADVIVVESQDTNVKFDRFDENLVSFDGQLKLKLSDETVITLQDGSDFDGEIANRKLVVSYGISTKSIPAQTTPLSIVVLFEKAVPPLLEVTVPFETVVPPLLEVIAPIRVNGEITDAPSAFVNEDDMVMVPLRAIAEALGYEVEWNQESQSVTVGSSIFLKIGEDSYTFEQMAPIELKAAPKIVEGHTFVPLSFFRTVVNAKTASYIESEIIIDMESAYEE